MSGADGERPSAPPHRRLAPGRLVVASHNAGKVQEIRDLLAPFGIDTVSAAEFGLPVPEETETTFTGNARLKAHAAAAATGLPALSDDSGLSVAALDGAPGVYTADWAETPSGRDFARAMGLVRARLAERGVDLAAGAPAAATFHCALTLAWPDGHDETFLGACPGGLVWPPRGDLGFGYDPMFVPTAGEGSQTFGEIARAAKHGMSHRADAFAQLVAACLSG
ncbi:MAG: non-canonical purine NTP pyrophosphatase [Pseudomonadota bacterium]